MVYENLSQEVIWNDINQRSNKEINQNQLMGKTHKNLCITLNYTKDWLILTYVVTKFVLISAFGSLTGITRGITEIAGIKKCNSTIKRKKSIMK